MIRKATLELLENADIPPPQARAIVQALEDEMISGTEHLATRHDLQLLQGAMRLEIAGVREELHGDMSSFKDEMRGDMSSFKAEMRGEMSSLRGEFSTEMRALRGEVRADILALKQSVDGRFESLQSAINANRRWILLSLLTMSTIVLTATHFIIEARLP